LERDGDYRAATVDKLKDGQGEGDEFAFHLHGVNLGVDEDGEAITSCVALPGHLNGAAGPKGKGVRGDIPKAILDQAQIAIDLAGTVTSGELIDNVVAALDAEEGQKDKRRRDKVLTAIKRLVEKDLLLIDRQGVVTLP
jgi:hypothetical protein